MSKICKDGRVWGQNNKEAGNHLGVSTGKKSLIKKGYNPNSGKNGFKKGSRLGIKGWFKKGHSLWRGRVVPKGEKHYRWRGGASSERQKIQGTLEYKQWRKAVFERDHFTCLVCGQVGGCINAHHIKAFKKYPELKLNTDNGITMCIKCHRLNHKKGESD